MDNLFVLRPEPHVFEDFQPNEDKTPASPGLSKMMKTSQKTLLYYTKQTTYPETGGMYMEYVGVKYLRQGFVFPEAIDNVNKLKRLSVLFLSLINGKGIKGRIGSFLAHFTRVADWMFLWYDPVSKQTHTIYLKDNRYRQSIRELIKFINNFLDFLGIEVKEENGLKKNFGRVIGTMIENDNAYYWRMEDVFRETSKEKLLANPSKELTRLLNIYISREKSTDIFKAQAIIKFLKIAFWLPGVKKAFKKAIDSVDIEKFKMTSDDRYFTMIYEGYDFEGKTIEERTKIWLDMSGGVPPPRVVINN